MPEILKILIFIILPLGLAIWIIRWLSAKRSKFLSTYASTRGFSFDPRKRKSPDPDLAFLNDSCTIRKTIHGCLSRNVQGGGVAIFDFESPEGGHSAETICIFRSKADFGRIQISYVDSRKNRRIFLNPEIITDLHQVTLTGDPSFGTTYLVRSQDPDKAHHLISRDVQSALSAHNKSWPLVVDISRSVIAVRTGKLKETVDLDHLFAVTRRLYELLTARGGT